MRKGDLKVAPSALTEGHTMETMYSLQEQLVLLHLEFYQQELLEYLNIEKLVLLDLEFYEEGFD